ncbi:NAD(P)/FAD-dependent oxidoreductase [Altererythrobacter aquiaggeris]|uniref:flavin-containing monooxygenase n=1 Tax=Aestuarierythrobacter aquiaggeris TaxID=1898396 RepID=UPI003018D5BC
MTAPNPDFDVLIVGAGISGIGMAAHLEMMCPDRTYTVVERRENLGGTWDLFRYPGIRSDSDMHTLGFNFEPWTHEKSIADGPSILEYLNRIVDERGIRGHIQFERKVISADWRAADACWHVTLENADGWQKEVTANWVYLGSGYYDYDQPYEAEFAGRDDFAGQIIHPQFWPEGLDYAGKNIVVIGSGATAVTIVPAMTDKAAKVTMLQRTPTWCGIAPSKDPLANILRKFLPDKVAYKVTRAKNIWMQDFVFKKARSQPQKIADALTKRIKNELGEAYDAEAFTPPYDPWDQRLCLVPDADLFSAIKAGKADVVTDRIVRFVAEGVELASGKVLPADIIVTATGLALAVAGKIDIRQEGTSVDFSERFYYKGCMFSNLPNLAVVFGYLNASWTLRSDINSEYVCKVLNEMRNRGATIASPHLPDDHALVEDDIFDFSSGYIQRSKHIMPKNAVDLPWRLNQDYRKDKKDLAKQPVDDGILKFGNADVKTPQMEPAQ